MQKRYVLFTLFTVIFASSSFSQSLPGGFKWHYNFSNGHYYTITENLTFQESRDLAQSLGAHLVTITSLNELNFVKTIFPNGGWIGLFNEGDGWQWVTGEPFDFALWLGTEDDDNEPYAFLTSDGLFASDTDQPRKAIIEIEGIIPTPTPTIFATPTPVPPDLPQGYNWMQNPRNANFYTMIDLPMTWPNAKMFAEDLGGHLLVINNQNEQTFIEANFTGFINQEFWLGLQNVDGVWRWITAEPLEFTNWAPREPNGDGPYAEIEANGSLWNDPSGSAENWFIIEIETVPLPPTPTFTFTPTYTPTQTPTITPTPTFTNTPTPTLTPTPLPPNSFLLTGDTLEENNLISAPVPGFNGGKISVVELDDALSSDGKGLEINLAPGQGMWINSTDVIEAESLVQISSMIKASNNTVSFALIALNSPVDGQIAYTNITSDEIPTDTYRRLNLLYDPPDDKLQVAFQVVNSPFAVISSKVWIDSYQVEDQSPSTLGQAVDLSVDGSFQNNVDQLIINANDADGNVERFFETITNVAMRLEIDETQNAANLGTVVQDIDDQLPLQLNAKVNVKREYSTGGAMFAFVLTNGFQNIGLFRFVNELPLTLGEQGEQSEQIILGGDFNVTNPNTPIMIFAQNGGLPASASIVVDNLNVFRR